MDFTRKVNRAQTWNWADSFRIRKTHLDAAPSRWTIGVTSFPVNIVESIQFEYWMKSWDVWEGEGVIYMSSPIIRSSTSTANNSNACYVRFAKLAFQVSSISFACLDQSSHHHSNYFFSFLHVIALTTSSTGLLIFPRICFSSTDKNVKLPWHWETHG